MKNFVRNVFLFSIFALANYIILIIIWGDYAHIFLKKNLNYRIGSYGHMFSRIKEIPNLKEIDILFLGSSHSYRGFDTRIFKKNNLNTFNLGSSGQTPLQTEILMKRYLKIIKPKLIIFEVYPNTFSIDGVESTLDIIANDEIDFEIIKLAFKQNNIKIYNTLIYGLYYDILNKKKDFKEEIIKGDNKYIKGGFVEKKLKYFKNIEYNKKNRNFKQKQFDAFENIISLFKKGNYKFIFVQAPLTKSIYNSYRNNVFFDKKMEKYGFYFNFNEIIFLNDSLHFYNSDHLNQNGVEIFNLKLIEILNKQKII